MGLLSQDGYRRGNSTHSKEGPDFIAGLRAYRRLARWVRCRGWGLGLGSQQRDPATILSTHPTGFRLVALLQDLTPMFLTPMFPGCSGTTARGCTRHWPTSARCSSKKTGWPVNPGAPAHRPVKGYGIQGQAQTAYQSQRSLLKLRTRDHAAIGQSQSSRHSNSGHESGTNPRPKVRQAGTS